MTKPHFVGKHFRLYIEPIGGGEFVEVKPLAGPPKAIVCSPVAGRYGVEYVPDWYGITHHG